jgi:glycosyltransferase involved in cell wall biosynthesis
VRAIVVSEFMGGRLDEGIRKFATHLLAGLSSHCDATGITTQGESDASRHIESVHGGKLFGGRLLRERIAGARPDLIVYVPSASGTLFSFLRAQALKRAFPSAKLAIVLTQGRHHSAPVRMMLRKLAPDAVFCQSFPTMRYLESLGIKAQFLPSGVDTDRFRPMVPGTRAALRAKYGLPDGEFLVLHAGHLVRGRNAGLLGRLEWIGRGVMLAGRSMGLDSSLKKELEGRGVIVVDRYIENVEELYQAADCYLFPVREDDSAMEFPLSVLEAMACNLPVVAHPYGGLLMALRAHEGLAFGEDDDALLAGLRAAKDLTRVDTRSQVIELTWAHVAGRLLQMMEEKEDARPVARAI